MSIQHRILTVPSSAHLGREQAATILKGRVPLHFRGVLEATRDFACSLLYAFQSDRPFSAPASAPWIAIIGDDSFAALGPAGFHEDSLKALFRDCAFVAIVATEALPTLYNMAATFAARDRMNAAVIETQPNQKDAWFALAREMQPEIAVSVSLPHEMLQ